MAVGYDAIPRDNNIVAKGGCCGASEGAGRMRASGGEWGRVGASGGEWACEGPSTSGACGDKASRGGEVERYGGAVWMCDRNERYCGVEG